MNLFQQERQKFLPRLPHLLRQIEGLDTTVGERRNVPLSIQSLLPQTASQPLIQFRAHAPKKRSALRVGVVLSGGQAPGGHNVITGLFDALRQINPSSRLFGFLGGPSGVIENRYTELNADILAPYRNTGGFDLVGSGRIKIETPQQFEAALKNCLTLNLDGLVIIGGDDSNTNAALLAEHFQLNGSPTRVIGVPKTIDGDLKNDLVETSFGFDTACKIYSEMIGNICRDALSAKKYTHFIKLMGRSASHITLECALQTHPNIALIGEEVAFKKMTLHALIDMLCEVISKRAEKGKNYGVVLIPEGLIEFIPEMTTLIGELNNLLSQGKEDVLKHLSPSAAATFTFLPEAMRRQLLLDRDPHGNVQVSHIATEHMLIQLVTERLKTWPGYTGKFNPIGHFLGYEGRSGYPSNFDANYCYALGYTAAALVGCGVTGYMSALQKLVDAPEGWIPVGLPITWMMDMEERKGKKKPVIKKALVNLSEGPFKHFSASREEWSLHDDYRFPGPIQFAGLPQICDETTFTLQFEQQDLKTFSTT